MRRVPVCKYCMRASCWQLIHRCKEPSKRPHLVAPSYSDVDRELKAFFTVSWVYAGELRRREAGLPPAATRLLGRDDAT